MILITNLSNPSSLVHPQLVWWKECHKASNTDKQHQLHSFYSDTGWMYDLW